MLYFSRSFFSAAATQKLSKSVRIWQQMQSVASLRRGSGANGATRPEPCLGSILRSAQIRWETIITGVGEGTTSISTWCAWASTWTKHETDYRCISQLQPNAASQCPHIQQIADGSTHFITREWTPVVVFTARRCMECRRGLAMRILSVGLSVCLSNAWIVTKQ